MNLQIRYTTTFNYPKTVRDSHNVLKACPTSNAAQTLESYDLAIDPPARVFSYVDYWGTRVDSFGIFEPHEQLTIVATSHVVTHPAPSIDLSIDVARYAEPDYRVEYRAYLDPTRHTEWTPPLAELARDTVHGVEDANGAATRLMEAVRDRLSYAPGSTYVGMELAQVLENGQGVCQDYAHAHIALARSVGIPARYVSGYLYAADQSLGSTPDEAEIDVETHAWVEIHIPGWGWQPFDPTNGTPVAESHVKIGHGRDYDDVAPLRGVYHGPEDHELGVSVRISREELAGRQSQQ
ncbi:MAG: transglutaminase family protein [Acidimicrobiia bacterium]|nr:transglutaminase family protein [Acidimicrobiia bacterium]NNF09120.1 transglutaminase family protein [Acidimicrobiia bacterium]NNL70467.1 transglutaminase family protein [Acidimicrobiia bacterium]